jgi:hypothetical protein
MLKGMLLLILRQAAKSAEGQQRSGRYAVTEKIACA